MNVTAYGWTSDPAGPNAYSVTTQDGDTLYLGTLPAGQYRRLGSTDSGSSGTVGRGQALAAKAIAATGKARRYYTARIIAVAGAAPYVDYDPCDVVHGWGYRGLGLNLEVTAMSWEQGDTTPFTLELAEPVT